MALSTIPPWPEAEVSVLAFARARDGQMRNLFLSVSGPRSLAA